MFSRILSAFGLCLSILLVSAQSSTVIASTGTRTQARQQRGVRVIKDKPTVYISFERVGKRAPLRNGESDEGVWLRVHNNTRWPIFLDMNDVPSERYGDAVLFYEVLSDEKVVIDARCHVCSVSKLPPGKSIVFSLARNYLAEGDAIRISFNYEWEADENGSTSLEPQHYIYFYSSDLPQKLQSKQ